MNLATALSPALWELLKRCRLQSPAALELFNAELDPVFDSSSDPRAEAARTAAGIEFRAREEMSFRQVLRSGEDARVRFAGWQLALLPIRLENRPIALLVVVAEAQGTTAEDVAPHTHGEVWRSAIEADLRTAKSARAIDQRIQRAEAITRLALDLQGCEDERQLIDVVLQTLSLWYDVEARVYCRDLAGNFVLRARLPGVDPATVPHVLDRASLPPLPEMTPSSHVQQLGLHGQRGQWCFLIWSGSAEQWLITAAGSVQAAETRQLESLFRAFSAALERVRSAEAERLIARLSQTLTGPGDRPPIPVATALLFVLCRELEGTRARWTTDNLSPQGAPAARWISLSLPIVGDRAAEIELHRLDGDAFRPNQYEMLLALAPLLNAWLSGGAGATVWTASVTLDPSGNTGAAVTTVQTLQHDA